jgi:hypothetical protein
MPQQAPGIREALFGGVRSPSRVIRHLCGSALRQPRSSTGADKAMAATCLLEGCEPAAMLQILSRNPEVPISASVWPLIRDLARTGRSDGWVAKPSVSGKEAESLGFPLVPVPVPQLAEAIVSQSAH